VPQAYWQHIRASSVMGKKTWTPGKTLPRFIAGTFGIPLRDQALLVEAIGDAVTEVVPLVQEKMAEQADFRDIGKRMLLAWQQGVNDLREKRVYAGGDWPGNKVFEGISDPPKLANPSTAIGRSPLINRSKRPRK
jgi:serine/threonine-protein kinase HipA